MDNLLYFLIVWTLVTIFSGQCAHGRGCYTDPKIYIAKVPQERQLIVILDAMRACLNSTYQTKPTLTGLHCPFVFDNIMCWPETEAGTVLEQACPDYINNFDIRGKARRECLPNGEWYVNPRTNRTWTDFNECTQLHVKDPGDEFLMLKDHLPTIRRLYMIGYSISLAVLSVAIVLMLRFRRLHCQRNAIHINLFVSFALRSVICLIKDIFHTPEGSTTIINNTVTITSLGSNWPCKLVFSIFNYIIVANYVWIFMEGFYLHNIIFITTFKKSKRFFLYILFGWCSPVLCIIPWVIVRRVLEDTLCWSTHSAENKFVWIIRGPIVVTIVINFLFFLNIVRVLFTKLTALHMSDPHRYRKLARSTLVLIPLFGVYYMISVVMPECMDPDVELIWLYTESSVNSFQGLIVAILFCFCNGEVQQEIRKKWTRRWMLRRFSTVSSRSTRTLSLGSTGFVKDKPIPSALFTDVTINVTIDDRLNGHVGSKDIQPGDGIINNNILNEKTPPTNEQAPPTSEQDTLL
ncbi:secretin receptor-like [Ostrea edulis]|uniref:secretin receptor-like n=1 Tax=Ostrea edulis TaxID=37623 RepID=UPI002094782F|nr:secretin receptor-like [Ostrea edulis]XP_048769253.1 secretin receptor-like [Ostrea edulis]XP_048769254.1 secretin receptor-like [Ostrea edulis]XP_048769255.1 secretin receptor-like [Ostrea edulis]XP_056015371.1 secretin receptor-like [Ostrea edulis]XP_056015372.1 secretin receptor-like [Ostrea edulis]